MLGEPHDLMHEFPEFAQKITDLRRGDQAFARLMDEYDQVDAEVRGLEELGQPVTDETMEELKKKRAVLKDRLYVRLKK